MSDRLSYPTRWPREATPTNLVPMFAGEFRSFEDWVSFATARLTGCLDSNGHEISAICVDALGRRCANGRDMAQARDENAFPVRYFWECEPGPSREETRVALELSQDQAAILLSLVRPAQAAPEFSKSLANALCASTKRRPALLEATKDGDKKVYALNATGRRIVNLLAGWEQAEMPATEIGQAADT